MAQNIISLKSINEILVFKFFIPSYQRGYRWTGRQVEDLLNDIYEFSKRPVKREEDIYCLQPVVVKDREGKWELIDGQQRLTTIYIILSYLQKRKFEIEFETRDKSKDFLINIGNKIDETNIDFFHISKAYSVTKNWFEEKENENAEYTVKDEFNISLGKFTKVIWYQVNDGSDLREIFTRINIGKIPLTNSELIKAVFLRSNNFGSEDENEKIYLKQLEIAGEWDRIEYALQNDEFWFFINKSENQLATRIEFIFDLIAEKNFNHDEYFTFRFFNDKFNKNEHGHIEKVWKEIKKYFLTFEEWFNDKELYHLVGFLITVGVSISDLKNELHNRTKTEFLAYLRNRIKKQVNFDISILEYGKDNNNITKTLLLFNIITILNNPKSNYRFPFDRFKNEKWSLEHIHAQNSDGLNSSKQFNSWLSAHAESLKRIDAKTHSKLISEIEDTNSEKLSLDEFNVLFEKVMAIFKDNNQQDEIHGIQNLALLDKDSNSSLNKSIFEVKRKIIIEREKNGWFIPICTRNVFLKYYSTNTSQLYFWSDEDRKDYLTNIREVLQDYLPVNQMAIS
jgi:uncharacterized protein with ParB-like and HNH nuclease domain